MAGGPARAQTAVSRDARAVQRLFREGSAAFDAHDDAVALSRFQEAYRLSEQPGLLVNIGRVLARMGRHDEALETLRRFLELSPDGPERPTIESMIRDSEASREAARAASNGAGSASPAGPTTSPTSGPTPRPRVIVGPGPAPWIVLGLGAAAAASATIPWFVVREPALSALNTSPSCVARADELLCFDPDGALAGRYDSARTATALAGVLAGVGAATILTGAIWAAVGRREAPVTVALDPRGTLVLAGTLGGRR